MGILSTIGGVISGVIGAVLDGIDYIVDSVRSIFGIEEKEKVKRKLTEEDKSIIRHELRQQWLSIPEGGRQEIPGVEYEDEVYYETPK